MERDLGADLKKQLLAEAPGRAIKYLPKKLKPIATQAEKLTEGDSRAFVERYFGPFYSPSGQQTFLTLARNAILPSAGPAQARFSGPDASWNAPSVLGSSACVCSELHNTQS